MTKPTQKIYRQQTTPRHLESLQTGENIQQYQSAAVNTTGASGQHFTQSRASGHLRSSTMISTENMSSPTNTGKKPVPTAESPKIAAVLFRSTVLALLDAGFLRRGEDDDGNTVIVLPRQYWNELRLK